MSIQLPTTDESPMPAPTRTAGEIGYLVYARVVGGIGPDGRTMRPWSALLPETRAAWERAAREVTHGR